MIRLPFPTRLPIVALLLFLAAGAGVVQGQPGHVDAAGPVEAAAESGLRVATADDIDLHADDYNKPPLPGSARGLLTLFIYSLVLFGLFLLLARTLVWTPLIRALDQREERVNRAYAEAEAARQEATKLLAMHDTRMAEARDEVAGIVAQGRREGERLKAEILAQAEVDARRLREESIAEIIRARNEAASQLEQAIDAQVALATEHIVGHPIG